MQKILIVDDDEFTLRITNMMLSKHYKTVCALSGKEAIRLFELEKPDMVLSDLLMPEMDGYELHRILQEKATEHVPIMFMTSDESDESESKGFALGAADYIRKPFKLDVLIRRVGNILKNVDSIRGLKQAVDIDPMTGLLNKSASQRKIGELCSQKQGVLMMIDLDSFKLVNDIYGHNMGDRILIRFSELIKEVIRSSDLAGRMGGDEFIAYCQNVHDESVIDEKTTYLNEKLLISAKEYMGEDMSIPLGTSIGAVFAPNEGTDFVTLCKKADQALYKVKQNGKHGCAFYGPTHVEELSTASQKTISHMRMILGERNIKTGAYFVEVEQFKIIYRLSARLVINYQKDIQFMQITVDTKDNSILDEFREMLIKTLRRSDCVTQNGKNQFLVMLMEAKSEEGEIVKDRIISNWEQSTNSANCNISFEIESITD
ncbi:MAG: diguanylate cyclase [Selenomonadaceae bacterium]|nr:diguanylate cyclase [Selenomonadaceae bacterium]